MNSVQSSWKSHALCVTVQNAPGSLQGRIKGVMQGKLIAVVYTLRTH